LAHIIYDDVLFVRVLVLGFTGKYINLPNNLVVVILRAAVPGNVSGLSAVVTGVV
jgi:hypothetical protein